VTICTTFEGYGKADADRAAGRRDDRGVYADHIAVEVEQRAARIAAIDGGVGLDVVVVGTGIDVSVARRHDAGGDEPPRLNGLPMAITHSPRRTLSESPELDRLDWLGRRRHLQHREIGLGVAPDDLGLEPRAVGEDDGDLVGFRDHVVVGDHDAGGVDDKAGAERVHAARRAIGSLFVAALAAAVLEELLEELLERRARWKLRHGLLAAAGAAASLDLLRGRDVDHRVDHLLGDVGDVFRAAGKCRRREDGQRENSGGHRGQCRLPDDMCEGSEHASHGRQFS
jgi:hypothetical protein